MKIIWNEKKKRKYSNSDIGGNESFRLVPIGTNRKGPIYTIVENSRYHQVVRHGKKISMRYNIAYSFFDCGVVDPFEVRIPEISNPFMVQPNLSQLFHFDVFCEKHDLLDYITIGEIEIVSNNKKYNIRMDDTNESIRSIALSESIETDVSRIFPNEDSVLILYKDGFCDFVSRSQFSCSSYLNLDFDFLLFPMISLESVFVLSHDEFQTFSSIDHISVQMLWQDVTPINEIYAVGLSDLIEVLFFFPQLLLMEDVIYHSNPGYRLSVTLTLPPDLPSAILEVNARELHTEKPEVVNLFYVLKCFTEYIMNII